jgi:hypothetical protein
MAETVKTTDEICAEIQGCIGQVAELQAERNRAWATAHGLSSLLDDAKDSINKLIVERDSLARELAAEREAHFNADRRADNHEIARQEERTARLTLARELETKISAPAPAQDAREAAFKEAANFIKETAADWRAEGEMLKVYACQYLERELRLRAAAPSVDKPTIASE